MFPIPSEWRHPTLPLKAGRQGFISGRRPDPGVCHLRKTCPSSDLAERQQSCSLWRKQGMTFRKSKRTQPTLSNIINIYSALHKYSPPWMFYPFIAFINQSWSILSWLFWRKKITKKPSLMSKWKQISTQLCQLNKNTDMEQYRHGTVAELKKSEEFSHIPNLISHRLSHPLMVGPRSALKANDRQLWVWDGVMGWV